jgi:transcriptional regulator with XRE-family HTH domain
MRFSVADVRRLLANPPTVATADALKEWRSRNGYSQIEAAIRLGVPVRTLQGWELGRPMPYPLLLQRASGIPLQAEVRPSLTQADFPREFAEFIDFAGASDLDKEIHKVIKRLSGLPAEVSAIYGDRYFFQLQFMKFAHDNKSPFFLDINDATAVRAASLIAGVNRAKRSLSASGVNRLRSTVVDNLKLDRDMRQLEHEIRCATHFGQFGLKVEFADLEGKGRFDLLVTTPQGTVEVECKTLAEDTGSQLKKQMAVSLAERFFRHAPKLGSKESGLFTMTLRKPSDKCKRLPEQLEAALRVRNFDSADFSFGFTPVPKWQRLLDEGKIDELQRALRSDFSEGEFSRSVSHGNGAVVALDVRPHCLPDLNKRVVDVLQQAADQCTGQRPGFVWLHFNGHPEDEIREVFQFSVENSGVGLNYSVAMALHPDASTTDRSHVQRVRFSCTGATLARHISPDDMRVLRRSVSQGGLCYDATNPLTKFRDLIEV